MRNRTYAYIGTGKRCGACALKAQCTRGAFRFLAIHMDEPGRQRARELANTPAFAHAQRQRKKVEAYNRGQEFIPITDFFNTHVCFRRLPLGHV
jgi:hypothetical protein